MKFTESTLNRHPYFPRCSWKTYDTPDFKICTSRLTVTYWKLHANLRPACATPLLGAYTVPSCMALFQKVKMLTWHSSQRTNLRRHHHHHTPILTSFALFSGPCLNIMWTYTTTSWVDVTYKMNSFMQTITYWWCNNFWNTPHVSFCYNGIPLHVPHFAYFTFPAYYWAFSLSMWNKFIIKTYLSILIFHLPNRFM
jgi:hypothetical protein